MSSNILNYVERLEEEFQEIFNHVEFYADFFYKRKDSVIDDISDEVTALLDEYCFEISDIADEENNQKIIEQINELLSRTLQEKEDLLNSLEVKAIPEWSSGLKIIEDEYGLVSYLDPIYLDMSFEEYQDYLENLDPSSLKNDIDSMPKSELHYTRFLVDDYSKLIKYVQIMSFNAHIENIEGDINDLIDSITIYGMMNAKSQTNIFRQGFILLTTAFDAFITDVSSATLSNDFFGFLEKTDCKVKSKNYKLAEIVSDGNFDVFKEKIIDEIIKDNYVSGLLRLLYQYNSAYFVADTTDCFKDLCEIISRRNLHIHKRGIVDKKYFDDAQGNIYSLNLGEYAIITSEYFERAYDLLLQTGKRFELNAENAVQVVAP